MCLLDTGCAYDMLISQSRLTYAAVRYLRADNLQSQSPDSLEGMNTLLSFKLQMVRRSSTF